MKEGNQGPQRVDVVEAQVDVEGVNGPLVRQIPSDDEGSDRMVVMNWRGGDIVLHMSTMPGEPYFYGSMIFRNPFAGSALPHISTELDLIIASFIDNEGQEASDKFSKVDLPKVTIPNYINVEVERGRVDQESLLVVRNIPSDDLTEDEMVFIDIEVDRNEDVTVVMRHPALQRMGEKFKPQGSMLFKTMENGGKFPVMNAIFRSIAERIADGDISTSNSSDRLHA